MAHWSQVEYELLGDDTPGDEATEHAFKTAPVFTGDALDALGPASLSQRAVYGKVLSQHADGFPTVPKSPILYVNSNAPFSGLVCGVQGTGKSHSTSVLLESCLIKDTRLGTLWKPLSALVFHFDTAAGGGAVRPCEAAYLSMLDTRRGGNAGAPPVTVLVLPSNIEAMREVYSELPAVNVEPLHFSAEDINGERLLAIMKVDDNGQRPLYIEAVLAILRDMTGSRFDYDKFREELKTKEFTQTQKAMLNLRLSLLDSCLKGGDSENRVSTHFQIGQLTIIDLSSPFMNGTSACGFFDLILGLFIQTDMKPYGKVVVLDEAHKYLSDAQSGMSSRLTESLLTVVRQHRHLATRVIISTQEPTVVPTKFLALCSFIIAHRFQSPEWLRVLTKHVSVKKEQEDELFSKITSLRTGQAIMFAPSGISLRSDWRPTTGTGDSRQMSVDQLGAGYLVVKSRQRITMDGGQSILVVDDLAGTPSSGPGAGIISDRGADERPSGFAQSLTTIASSSSGDSPAPPASSATGSDDDDSTESAKSSGTMSSSAASWEKYKPLVDFIDQKHGEGVHQVFVWIIEKHFEYQDEFAATLDEAIKLGLLERGTPHWQNDDERVMVSSSARAIMERKLISLEGEHARFVPLVRYLQGQAASGFREINAATIERRLGEGIVAVVGDAEAAGVVQMVPNSMKPKVRLPSDTHFALF